jgi:predicted dehydrogenase
MTGIATAVPTPGAATARPLRVGIIGAGNIARNHVEGYRAAGVRIVGIADTQPATLERRAREWDVEHAFLDVGELLALPGLDAVSVCTPNAAHHGATLAAAAAGVHVLCEKPVSLSLAEADEMIEACRRAGVVLAIDHHLRNNPSVERARAMIAAGTIGRVTFVRMRQAHDWSGAPEVPPGFRTPAIAGGGTLLDNGCHLFDLARHLAGPVADVFARTATLGFEVEVEDTAQVSLRFASGALGQIETSWTSTGWDQGFTVNGTHGSLEYTERLGRPVLRFVHREAGDDDWAATRVTAWEHAGDGDHIRAVGAFVAAVRGERPVACTGEDGREAVRLALASYESAATGLPVTIAG